MLAAVDDAAASRGRTKPRHRPAQGWRFAALLWACWALGGAVHAEETAQELWPEASVFYKLSPGTRIYLDGNHSRGKESDTLSGDVSAFFDISIKPIVPERLPALAKRLPMTDWQRSRLFWARIGYTRVFKATDGSRTVSEDRGSVALYRKVPLPAEVWLEGRARADLRWLGGDYSTRYRARIEATRELVVKEHAVVPYANYEWFYDTRYDGWSRSLLQAGAEITLNEHFRYELYLARQEDRLPEASAMNAFGVVAKWYY